MTDVPSPSAEPSPTVGPTDPNTAAALDLVRLEHDLEPPSETPEEAPKTVEASTTTNPIIGAVRAPGGGLWIAYSDGTVDSEGDAEEFEVPELSSKVVAVVAGPRDGFTLLEEDGTVHEVASALVSAPAEVK
jgi:hypothetical protein